MIATLLCPTQCQLGEGPFWFQQRLYWFDILQCRLHHCDAAGLDLQTIPLPEMFSAAAALDTGELLMASETGLWRFEPRSQHLQKWRDLEADNPITRSNDGRADRHGGFWIGTMGKNAEPQAGAIYRYYRGEIIPLVTGISISNAICFSPDGHYAYYTDTTQAVIKRFDLDAEGFPIGDALDWLDLRAEGLNPDGAAIDSAGYVWNAQWGSCRLARYSPAAELVEVVDVPVSQVSCPVFIGADLLQMACTTARVGLSAERLAAEPLAGGVFVVDLAVKGCADGVVRLNF